MHELTVKKEFCKEDIITILLNGKIDLEGQFILGSNYTFLVKISFQEQTLEAVYKPMKGEVPLWDFPQESLAAREAAAYITSEILHWNLVPPTAIRESGPFGGGSIQLFIPHNPELNYFSLDMETRQRLRKTVLFDMLINNADRKGSHIILDEKDHIWLIDHGLCFHSQPKLRTVIWDFAGERIEDQLIAELEELLQSVETVSKLTEELANLLKKEEIDALKSRILYIIKHPVFPTPDEEKRQFPWPLV